MKILILVILSMLSGVAYRAGGWDKGNRMYRILGVPLITIIWLLTQKVGLTQVNWQAILSYFLTFGLSAGMISAYWGQDEKKWGYWCHGLGLSLALLPIAIITGHWWGFAIRTVVLTGFITVWSQLTKWDIWEDRGRGASIIASMPLLLI